MYLHIYFPEDVFEIQVVLLMLQNCKSVLYDPSESALLTDCTYRIKTKTGTKAYAGTDALVKIRLYGIYKSCGWRSLNNPGNDFEKGR